MLTSPGPANEPDAFARLCWSQQGWLLTLSILHGSCALSLTMSNELHLPTLCLMKAQDMHHWLILMHALLAHLAETLRPLAQLPTPVTPVELLHRACQVSLVSVCPCDINL